MRLVFLLSLLINWHLVDGCLKVNRLSSCGCHALALDSSNIRDYVDEDNQSFSFLPNSTLTAPNVNIDECSIEMTCGLGYNLAIFDAALMIKWFNDYPAVGFCNPATREWSILTRDTGFSQFVELYGTCAYVPTTTTVTSPTTSTVTTPTTTTVTTTEPTTTTVTTPTTSRVATSTTTSPVTTPTTATVTTTTTTWTTPSTASSSINSTTVPPGFCPCQRRLLDSSNIRDFITEDSIFYPALTSPSIVAPTNNSECSGIIFCPATHYLLIFDDTGLGRIASHFSQHSCDPVTKKWSVQTGSLAGPIVFRQIYGVCLEKGDETDFSSTQNLPSSSTTTRGITSTAETKSTTTREPTTSGELVCNPTDSRTFLFAYSTDFTADVVTKVFNNIANKSHPIYTRIATVREANKTLHSRLPDPSLGYNNNFNASDVRSVIERFFNEHSPEVFCGVKVWTLIKRDAVGVWLGSEAISKIRMYNGTIDTLISINMTAGTISTFMDIHYLSLFSNGMGYIHYDEDFDRVCTDATKFIPTPSLPYLYFAKNTEYRNNAGTYSGYGGVRVLAPATVWIAAAPLTNPFDRFGYSNVLLGNSSFPFTQLPVALHFTRAEMEMNGFSNHYGAYVKLEPATYSFRLFNNYTIVSWSSRFTQTRFYSDVNPSSSLLFHSFAANFTMRLAFFLSFLISCHLVNGCLKVNRISSCGCLALALNSSNIRDYVDEDNQSFSLLPNSTLTAPNVNIDECSIEMTCDMGYNLAVFDAALMIKWFNDYPAVGFCSPDTRQWSIMTRDTGFSQFLELYGTCVFVPTTTTVTTPTTTVTTIKPTTTPTTPPTTTSLPCICESLLLNSSVMPDYVEYYDIFYSDLTAVTTETPTRKITGCSEKYTCKPNYYLLIFDDTGLGITFPTSTSAQCDSTTQKWKVDTGSRAGPTVFQQIYALCLEGGSESLSTSLTPKTSITTEGVTNTTQSVTVVTTSTHTAPTEVHINTKTASPRISIPTTAQDTISTHPTITTPTAISTTPTTTSTTSQTTGTQPVTTNITTPTTTINATSSSTLTSPQTTSTSTSTTLPTTPTAQDTITTIMNATSSSSLTSPQTTNTPTPTTLTTTPTEATTIVDITTKTSSLPISLSTTAQETSRTDTTTSNITSVPSSTSTDSHTTGTVAVTTNSTTKMIGESTTTPSTSFTTEVTTTTMNATSPTTLTSPQTTNTPSSTTLTTTPTAQDTSSTSTTITSTPTTTPTTTITTTPASTSTFSQTTNTSTVATTPTATSTAPSTTPLTTIETTLTTSPTPTTTSTTTPTITSTTTVSTTLTTTPTTTKTTPTTTTRTTTTLKPTTTTKDPTACLPNSPSTFMLAVSSDVGADQIDIYYKAVQSGVKTA
ncbi:hypothetical protein CAEBREN_24633 [Caenorhabditis brenneri]|uniref:Uncharacterized protein n=1 Tax=Caenorhabditis brenneri TaxID=135651 RepID=G0NCQ6_CAEBE|nr:hypothetical protein CAEBREN_24633 [Caenorhabditis brenneri]